MTPLLIALLILVPLAAGLVCWLVPSRALRIGLVIGSAVIVVGSALALALSGPGDAVRAPELGGAWVTLTTALEILLLGWFAYLGVTRRSIPVLVLTAVQMAGLFAVKFLSGAHPDHTPIFLVDSLAIVMVLVICVVGSVILIYAVPYMDDHEHHLRVAKSRQPQFFGLLLLFLAAMNGLVLADDLMLLFLFWEITTLCCVLLIAHDGTEIAVANSTRALWMNLIGGAAFVGAALWVSYGGMSFRVSEMLTDGSGVLLIPAAFLAIAGFTKSAHFPFTGWLLGAMVAPTPVSALLHSSTMVKAGVYLVLRFAPAYEGTPLSNLVAVVGAFTFVAGAMIAISQTNAKKVLAYSTVSNLGLIVACAGLNTPMAYSAALMLIVFHAISKALLFMTTGAIEQGIRSREIEDMEGLVARMPFTTWVAMIGILSMLLPPFGVIVAKWAAMEASAQLPVVMFLFVIGSAFTVVFWTKWMGRMLAAPPSPEPAKLEKLESLTAAPLALLAVLAIGLSIGVTPLLTQVVAPAVDEVYRATGYTGTFAGVGSEIGWFPVLLITCVIGAALIIPALVVRRRAATPDSVYLCGEGVREDPKVEFRGASDQPQEITIGGYYFDKIFGEKRHAVWVNAVGAVMVVAVIGVAVFAPDLNFVGVVR